MKKLTITIALLLVVAFAMPTFAQSFSDVPSDHWAYDAINKLVAAGIVEGYPDGEYKGDQNMTRYEMAVMVSRALDNIVAEQEAMAEEMDAMGEGLTTGQAEDVTAIVKSLMEKNTQDSLTDAQAEEVADIVDALTFELKAELKVLGADVDALGKDMAELEAKVDAMDVPQDNIEFGGEFKTIFEVANYGDASEEAATVALWDDGDALDGPDPDEFPAEKRFWQEIGINMNGNLNDAKFNLDIDTINNVFANEDSLNNYGVAPLAQGEQDLQLDSALLTVNYADAVITLGDHADYSVARYFVDEEDVEGVSASLNYLDTDWTFVAGGFGTDSESDIYGVTAEKDMEFGNVTGRLYQARKYYADADDDGVDELYNANVTALGLAVSDVALTDVVTMGGEFAVSNVDSDIDPFVSEDSDYLFNVNAEFAATEELTLTGKAETVGENFVAYAGDLEESNNYNMFNVGAEYVLNENNTITGGYTFVDHDQPEDKSTVEVALDNVYGDFTNNASLSYTMNDTYTDGYNTTVIELGTEYAWNETTTLGAALVNKNEDNDGTNVIKYNYLKGTLDKELADNMTWNTEAKYIMGEVNAAETEGVGNALTTSLTVSF
ncbi:S-layer homology domain-containing protein [Halanaerobium kushneri]|jgi:hypothetical protein|uniref:S-layer homology domain-containing protein n=2 Tax=Halanaerobium kushneri TaxID=56779 RepID=A0A1N7A3N0_9FIRM|nr:S-layer homology domain-containing protein [Halanaerobium kushneri]